MIGLKKLRNEKPEGINKLKQISVQELLITSKWGFWKKYLSVIQGFHCSASTAHFAWAGTALFSSKTAGTEQIVVDIFDPRTPCKKQCSYLSGTLRRPVNTKITTSVSLACTCYTSPTTPFTDGDPSQLPLPLPFSKGREERSGYSRLPIGYTTWCFLELHSLGITLNIYIISIASGFSSSMHISHCCCTGFW